MQERSFGAPAEQEPEVRKRLEESARRFRAAASYPETAAEASVRLSRVLWRLGRFEESLTALKPAIPENDDRSVNYLAHLFSGRALMSLGRIDDAIRSYETALDVLPNAAAATTALSVSYVLQGHADLGMTWAQRARTQPDVLDPWWRYWEGLGRFFPVWLDEVRKAAR
jgi:tetratricopeptide (TPR) repeat protein